MWKYTQWKVSADFHPCCECTAVKYNNKTPTVYAKQHEKCSLDATHFSFSPELENPEARAAEIHTIVHRLPEKNRQMLELLMKHLAK